MNKDELKQQKKEKAKKESEQIQTFLGILFLEWLGWKSYGYYHNKPQQSITTVQKGDIAREFQNSNPQDWHKNEKWQQLNGQLKNELGNQITKEQLNQLLKEIAQEQLQRVPIQLDSNTTLTNVHIDEATSTIFFMNEVIRPIGNVNTKQKEAKMISEQNFCKTNEVILRYGATISYVFYNNPEKGYNGNYQLMITPKDCGF